MTIRIRAWLALLLLSVSGLLCSPVRAQATAPAIRSLSVEQVPQLAPGTELVFRAAGSAAGALTLQVDGVPALIALPEAQPGTYEGAYTISIRDKIPYNAKVTATLKLGTREASRTLTQTLLTAPAHSAAEAAARPAPVIARVETKNSGALAGGHELNLLVQGTPGAKASASFDGGKTVIPLAETSAGQYGAAYTIKTRDQLSDATPLAVTLALGARATTVTKPLAAGVFVPVAAAPAPAGAPMPVATCVDCGVVQSVNKVKIKGKPNYVGAIAGGAAGALLGSQIGKGDGKTAGTVIGAVGGAVAGREVEKHVRSSTVYDVVVKLDGGATRTVRFEADPGFKAGAKVRISGETLVALP